jgi:hypothetical protein
MRWRRQKLVLVVNSDMPVLQFCAARRRCQLLRDAGVYKEGRFRFLKENSIDPW